MRLSDSGNRDIFDSLETCEKLLTAREVAIDFARGLDTALQYIGRIRHPAHSSGRCRLESRRPYRRATPPVRPPAVFFRILRQRPDALPGRFGIASQLPVLPTRKGIGGADAGSSVTRSQQASDIRARELLTQWRIRLREAYAIESD